MISLLSAWAHISTDSQHYNGVITSAMASQVTSHTIVYSTFIQGADQRKCQSSASLIFVRGIHWWSVNSPHKGPVTWKMFPFDDVISIGNPIVEIRLSYDRLIFTMGFPILVRWHLYIESGPGWFKTQWHTCDITVMSLLLLPPFW